MKNILVPTDFSSRANKALDFALQIAKKAKAEIILVHACDQINTTFKDNQTLYRVYNRLITDEAKEKLSFLKKRVAESGVSVKIKMYSGSVAETILQASEEHQADLVIMGSLGNKGIKEQLFGSIISEIVGRTSVPVMVVPQNSTWAGPKKIFLAVTNFKAKPDVTSLVFELAGVNNATVHMIIFNDTDLSDFDRIKSKNDANDYVGKLKASYKSIDIKHAYLVGNSFEEAIEKYIHEQGSGILAMVTSKRTFLQGIFNRSIIKKMCYTTRTPLLVIPAIKKLRFLKEAVEEENLSAVILG